MALLRHFVANPISSADSPLPSCLGSVWFKNIRTSSSPSPAASPSASVNYVVNGAVIGGCVIAAVVTLVLVASVIYLLWRCGRTKDIADVGNASPPGDTTIEQPPPRLPHEDAGEVARRVSSVAVGWASVGIRAQGGVVAGGDPVVEQPPTAKSRKVYALLAAAAAARAVVLDRSRSAGDVRDMPRERHNSGRQPIGGSSAASGAVSCRSSQRSSIAGTFTSVAGTPSQSQARVNHHVAPAGRVAAPYYPPQRGTPAAPTATRPPPFSALALAQARQAVVARAEAVPLSGPFPAVPPAAVPGVPFLPLQGPQGASSAPDKTRLWTKGGLSGPVAPVSSAEDVLSYRAWGDKSAWSGTGRSLASSATISARARDTASSLAPFSARDSDRRSPYWNHLGATIEDI